MKIINPFETYSEKKLALFGLFALLIGSLIGSLFNGRFDGIIDLHFVESISFLQVLSDNIINTILVSLMFYFLGKLINSKTRLIDLLTTALIARIPFYILPIFNLNNQMDEAGKRVIEMAANQSTESILLSDTALLLIFTIFSILALVWFSLLSWNGFKTATNSKEKKHIIYFIIVVIITEIISKIVFSQL